MEPAVRRTHHALGRFDGETTLEQTFRFDEVIDAAAVRNVLRSAPLVGADSIFGDRPGREDPPADPGRRLRGFSPAPGFRFDVEMTERGSDAVVVSISQPDRHRPYLAGDVVWFVRDGPGGPELHEEINTGTALAVGDRPLTGVSPSLRRWLFFRVGHARVMRAATANIAGLATSN